MAKSGCSKVLAKEVKKYVVQKVLVYEPMNADQRWGPNTKMMPDRACQIEQMKRSCMPKLCDCPQAKGKASLILNEICFGAKIVAFITLLKISIDAGIFGEQIRTNRLVDSVLINLDKMAAEKEEKEDADENELKKDKQEKKGKEEPKKTTTAEKNKETKEKEAKEKEAKEKEAIEKKPTTTSKAAKDENKMKKEKEAKKVKNSENTEYESEWTLASVWNALVVRIVNAILDFKAKDEVVPEKKPPVKQQQ